MYGPLYRCLAVVAAAAIAAPAPLKHLGVPLVLNIPIRSAPIRSAPISSAPEILIGVSNSQTGTSSSLGRELVTGSQAYFNLVNAHGGIDGSRIRLIVQDDHYDPEPAVSNTQDLITNHRVLFLFDYVGTPTLTRVLPLLRFYDAEHVVNVAPMTGSEPQRRAPYLDTVFNIRASYREEATALVEHLYAKGYRRFGFLGQSDAYGKSGEVAVADALGQHGLSIVSSVWYRRSAMFRNSSSMDVQLGILRRANVDAVIAFAVYGPAARFITEARSSKWSVPIANVSFVDADILMSRLARDSRQAAIDLTTNLVNSEVVPSPEQSQTQLAKDFRAHVPSNVRGYVSLEGWLNAAVATEALRRCAGSCSRMDFVRALASLNGWDPGLSVKLALSPDSNQGLHAVWVTASDEARWSSVGELVNGRYEEHSR